MKTLLRIDSSVRKIDSISRTMGDFFVSRWKEKNPDGKIIVRDLCLTPVPHLTLPVVQAFFGKSTPGEMLSLSDTLIDEIKGCDEILIASPMYNFQISSLLKAYIDHIVRVNVTFVYDNGEYRGLIDDKKCHIITTMGGRKADVNQGEGSEIYLRNILGFIGINNTQMFCVDGTSDLKYVNSAIEKTRDRILNII